MNTESKKEKNKIPGFHGMVRYQLHYKAQPLPSKGQKHKSLWRLLLSKGLIKMPLELVPFRNSDCGWHWGRKQGVMPARAAGSNDLMPFLGQ